MHHHSLQNFLFLFCAVLGEDFSPRINRQSVPTEIGPLVVPVGGTMMFNCSTRGQPGFVSWFRPGDNLQVSYNSQVMPGLQDRLRVLHNPQTGDYNLMLRYAQFPQDNGTWWCNVFGGPRIAYNLMVMVPPPTRVPQINPISGIVFQVTSEAWTFNCVAHHAYPPVLLQWVRKSGPNADFGALPPTMTVAPDGTIATSVKLILSPLNHGSEFSCVASHLTFAGKTFSSNIQFVIADTRAVNAGNFHNTFLLVRMRTINYCRANNSITCWKKLNLAFISGTDLIFCRYKRRNVYTQWR